MKSLAIFLTVVIVFCPIFGAAGIKELEESLGGPLSATDYDLLFLPTYCRCRMALNKDKYQHERKGWDRIFRSKGARGTGWVHVHHYCLGLVMLSRFNRGLGKRSVLLAKAEGEFRYVITNSNPNFILMPEIHLKMGITQKLMGNDVKAMQHFIQATKLKKNYVPPYLQLIDLYVRSQNINGAISTAKKGLKYSPNSQVLKKKLIELQPISK